jgi:RNA polymerase sigma factor (sigma-70 family)
MFSSFKHRKPNYNDQELVTMIQKGRGTPPHKKAVFYLGQHKLPFPVSQAYRKFDSLEERGGPSLEEVHNHTLLVVVQKIERREYKGTGTIDGFANRIAYFHCLKKVQLLAKVKNQPAAELTELHHYQYSENPEDHKEELLEAILVVLEKELSKDEYDTCLAVFYDGLNYQEYADQTGLSVSGVKKRMQKIMKKLGKIKNAIEKIVLP